MSKKFKNFCLYAFYAVVILAALFSLYSNFYVIPVVENYVEFEGDVLHAPPVEEETIFTSIREFFDILYQLLMKFFANIANIFSSGSAQVAPEEEVVAAAEEELGAVAAATAIP